LDEISDYVMNLNSLAIAWLERRDRRDTSRRQLWIFREKKERLINEALIGIRKEREGVGGV
jgi:hypothetical protein